MTLDDRLDPEKLGSLGVEVYDYQDTKQAILTDLLEITDSLQNDDGWIDKEVFKDKVRKYCE